MDAINELLARDRIRQLAVRYAVAVDAKDLETIAYLFADDVDNGQFGSGREGVRRFYDQSLRKFHCSVHTVANHLIDFADDGSATGVVYCHARHHVTDPEHWFDVALAYWDSYELIDGEWLFRRRRVRSWYTQYFDHPGHGGNRIVATPASTGPQRGGRMPETYSTFDQFWERGPLER